MVSLKSNIIKKPQLLPKIGITKWDKISFNPISTKIILKEIFKII